jgi:hypothetical protein
MTMAVADTPRQKLLLGNVLQALVLPGMLSNQPSTNCAMGKLKLTV